MCVPATCKLRDSSAGLCLISASSARRVLILNKADCSKVDIWANGTLASSLSFIQNAMSSRVIAVYFDLEITSWLKCQTDGLYFVREKNKTPGTDYC